MRHLKKGYARRCQTQFGTLVPNDVRNALTLDKENKISSEERVLGRRWRE
jgi:hypothetical protein